MNEEQLKGNWQQLKGKVQKAFGKLTKDDLTQVEGSGEELLGLIVERYGISKEKAQEKLNEFLGKFNDKGEEITKFVDQINDMASTVTDKGAEVADKCQQYAKKNPLAVAGITGLVGLLLGMLIAR